MNKIKISAVVYTNTKPFIYGIQKSEVSNQISLALDIPADCALKLINDQVDIGLVPVAVIPFVQGAKIVGDYCIGSVGAVNSVFILSNVPAAEIKTVKLDPESRTSNKLAEVLLKFHFKVPVEFKVNQDEDCDAIVLIGDRTFARKSEFKYAYDMGEEWMKFTGLPFVYAAWVANKSIPTPFIDDFNAALKLGLAQRQALLKELPSVPGFDLEDYLMNKLDFDLTSAKRKALNLFLEYLKEL
ncbi:menaquinone biosynthetic enzyme MqnA/MqnD family protein [Pedobacter insulae]|uniref:Chorismate dehydratase n=1 Tax=Pedobacter insulae TaxID=414048 RepID=A0A1I2WN52_9SPHI|nr:menaquinone biosynthesis protein [Pedobacter insulae]SFH02685.1 chorismate dehydratase [Pedobacter insulae]